jgi:hypothetical protein
MRKGSDSVFTSRCADGPDRPSREADPVNERAAPAPEVQFNRYPPPSLVRVVKDRSVDENRSRSALVETALTDVLSRAAPGSGQDAADPAAGAGSSPRSLR